MRWCFRYCCLFSLPGCGEPQRLITISGPTMGTTFQVKIAREDMALEAEVLHRAIHARLDEVNRQMSTYREDSEISRFNRSRSTDWVGVSPDFARVLSIAQKISTWSNGAFDVTVGPLVNLWGFGPNAIPDRVPPPDSIAACKARVGHEKVQVDLSASAIKKESAGVYCDLSAIAKGFGVDRVATYLDSLCINRYFVEIGGELRTKGRNHLGQRWRGWHCEAIGIRQTSKSTGSGQYVYGDVGRLP